MEPSTLKPTADAQKSERRHSDPPALWLAVILGSVVAHLCVFGILRLFLMGDFLGWQSANKIIPIDVITLAPNKTSQSRLKSTTDATTSSSPTSANTRTINPSNQRQNRPTSSHSNPFSTRTASSPTRKHQNNVQQPSSSKGKKSPVSNSSPNQHPAKPKPSINPDSSASKNSNSNSTTSSSNANSSTGSSTGNTSANNNSGSGFIAFPRVPILRNNTRDVIHPDDPNYNDKLATLKSYNSQFSSEKLASLGITLKSVLELKVGVVVEQSGTAILLPNATQVLRGDIGTDKAEQLAAKIMEQSRFNPTLMAGKAVSRDYYLQLTISPAPK